MTLMHIKVVVFRISETLISKLRRGLSDQIGNLPTAD